MQKKGFIFRAGPRGCNVALRAMWQHHASPRGAYAAGDVCYLHIYFIYYIVHKVQPSVYRKGFQPSKPSRLINASIAFNFFCVGL